MALGASFIRSRKKGRLIARPSPGTWTSNQPRSRAMPRRPRWGWMDAVIEGGWGHPKALPIPQHAHNSSGTLSVGGWAQPPPRARARSVERMPRHHSQRRRGTAYPTDGDWPGWLGVKVSDTSAPARFTLPYPLTNPEQPRV